MTSATGSERSGFTAIEMLVVLGVMITLGSMTVPALLPALRRARVNDAANIVIAAHAEARRLAMSNPEPTVFGIRIQDVVVKGQTRQSISLVRNNNVVENSARILNPSVLVQGPDKWFYTPGTGYPTSSSGSNTWTDIGLTVRSVDSTVQGKYRTAVTIYAIGIGNVQGM